MIDMSELIGTPIEGTTSIIVTNGSKHCFRCANKALRVMLGVFECLGEDNVGTYITFEASRFWTCPNWTETKQ